MQRPIKAQKINKKTTLKQQDIDTLLSQYRSGDYHSALVMALSLTDRFPEILFFWNILGASHKNLKQFSQARAAFEKTIELDSQRAEGHYNLGSVLQDQQDFNGAIGCYDRALALRPSFTQAHHNKGNAQQSLGRVRESVAAFRRALDIEPDNAGVLNSLAASLKQLRQFKEAEECLLKSITLQPEFAEAHNNLGAVYLDYDSRIDNHPIQQAVTHFKQAIRLKPNLIEAYTNLAGALRTLGELDEAENICREVIAHDEARHSAYARLGSILLAQGKHQEGLTANSRAHGAISFNLNKGLYIGG